jgi:hypothetical protein
VLHFPPWISVCILTAILFLTSACTPARNDVYEKTSQKSLPDILEDAEFSITEHNLRIVDRLHIGQSVRARGNKQFPDYEIILYCSLTLAEKMLLIDPALINICPGRITIRGTRDHYSIAAPLWPEHSGNAELNRLLHDMNGVVRTIVDYAASDWPAAPAHTDNSLYFKNHGTTLAGVGYIVKPVSLHRTP